MATVTHRVTTPDTGNTPNTSGAFSPASGDLLVVFVTKEASALSSPMASADLTSSVAPTGFTLIRNQGHQSSAAHIGVFVATALTTDTTSRTVTIASGSDAGAGTNISVLSVSGMTKVGSNAVRGQGGQTDQAAGTPAPAFGAAALTGNPCVGAIYNATNPAGLTQPSGWSEAADTGYTTGQVSGIQVSYRNSGETGTTITWGSASASAFASIILELDQSDPKEVTPGNAALTITLFAPTVTITDNKEVIPGIATLTITTYAPDVTVGTNVEPGPASLTITTFAPTVSVTENVEVIPGPASLTLTTFTPTVSVTNHIEVIPGTATLILTPFAPTVTATAHVEVVPGTANLTINLFAPTVSVSGSALPWSRGGIVPVRYVLSETANVVPVETVGSWEAGVVPVMEQVGPAHVVPVREAASETPRVKVVLVTPA